MNVSNELMHDLIDNLPFGVMLVDSNFTIKLINRTLLDILNINLDAKDFIDNPCDSLRPYLKNYLSDYQAIELRTKEIIKNKSSYKEEFYTFTGRILERSYIPILSKGSYKGHFWKLDDVTNEKRIKEGLIKAKENAEKANSTKSAFLSKMSHELRTPLNAILGFSQILEYDKEEPLTSNQYRKVQEILFAGRHLLNLIDEVLDLSKIESGNINFNIKPTRVDKILSQSINLVSSMAKEKNIEIIVECTSIENKVLFIDETRYKQIILNILTNSIKYNRDDGKVMVHAETKDSNFILQISDTGYGIPEEILPFIFDPFFRYKQLHPKVEGNGIGLSIAKLMTEKMGGKLNVESIHETGSTFSIVFPLIHNMKQLEIHPYSNSTDYEYLFMGRTVLYIEDNASNALLVEQIISHVRGIELRVSLSSEEGVRIAKQLQPDIILLDLDLPEISGYEVFKLLKESKKTTNIPVIAISAAAMEEDKKKIISIGFKDYVTKPINIPMFLSTLHKHLEGQSTRLPS